MFYFDPDHTKSCSCAALYLLAHADLHDGKVDECFPQIPVFLLLEVLHVHPCLFYMLSAKGSTKQSSHTVPVTNKRNMLTTLGRIHDSLALKCFLFNCLFTLSYELLQQLQPGLPLLGSFLAKQLVGHAFQGECPHNLLKESKDNVITTHV